MRHHASLRGSRGGGGGGGRNGGKETQQQDDLRQTKPQEAEPESFTLSSTITSSYRLVLK